MRALYFMTLCESSHRWNTTHCSPLKSKAFGPGWNGSSLIWQQAMHNCENTLSQHFMRNTSLILGRATVCSQNSLSSLVGIPEDVGNFHYTTSSLDCRHKAGWIHRLCSLRSLFLVHRCGTRFCCCSQSASRFDVLFILRCFSAHHSYKGWLSKSLKPFCQPQPVWPFSSDLFHQHFRSQICCLLDVFLFGFWQHSK